MVFGRLLLLPLTCIAYTLMLAHKQWLSCRIFLFKKLKAREGRVSQLCLAVYFYSLVWILPCWLFFFFFFFVFFCWHENWLSSHGKKWVELAVTKKQKNIFKLLVKDQPKRDLGMFRRTDTLRCCIRLVLILYFFSSFSI